jgi:hypothetical protein
LERRDGRVGFARIDDITLNGSQDAWETGIFAPFFPGRKMQLANASEIASRRMMATTIRFRRSTNRYCP